MSDSSAGCNQGPAAPLPGLGPAPAQQQLHEAASDLAQRLTQLLQRIQGVRARGWGAEGTPEAPAAIAGEVRQLEHYGAGMVHEAPVGECTWLWVGSGMQGCVAWWGM